MASEMKTKEFEATEAKQEVRYPGIRSAVDGSGAVVYVESHISQGACAYPITPSTPMGDGFGAEYAKGTRNLWDEPVVFLEPESEHSSASACEGFALAGGRVTNFTSGQGLILMKEVLYVISGKRLPVVFHIGARALTSHSLNVHAGHDDVMGVADVGWGILFARNAQEVADLSVIARRAAEDSETPFMNVMDGFLSTHTVETAFLPEPELMREFIGKPSERIRGLFDPLHPLLSGPVQNQDSYMKGKVAQRVFYDRVRPALEKAMADYGRLTGRRYNLVRSYRMEDADYALVAMGTMAETAEAAVDWLRVMGVNVGVISPTSFRPFPARELAQLLVGLKGFTVIERLDVPLAESNPLTLEIKAALADYQIEHPGKIERLPKIHSGVAGLGGAPVLPSYFAAAVENMLHHEGIKSFVVGPKHRDNLPAGPDADCRPVDAFTLRGHSVGGFGSVTTNKTIATVCSELFGLYVQAFPKYGAEKKGLPTSYYLTLASDAIRLHAEPSVAEFVAIQDPNAFLNGDPLAGLQREGTIYLQSALDGPTLWSSLPPAARAIIRERHLRLFVLDALKIARESSSRPDLQVRMQGIALLGAFLGLTPFRERAGLSAEAMFAGLEKVLTKFFGKKGGRVVADNLAIARRAFNEVKEVIPPPETEAHKHSESHAIPPLPLAPSNGDGLVPGDFCSRIVSAYATGREGEIEADEFAARSLIPPSSAAFRSFRNLAPEIPRLIPSACVGCMDCVNQCPDTAIVAKVAEPSVLDAQLGKVGRHDLREWLSNQWVKTSKYFDIPVKKGQAGGLFGLFIDPDKCKGCGECVVACGSHKALEMVTKQDGDMTRCDFGMDLFHSLPDTPARYLNEKALGDLMLAESAMLYAGGAGSCMGCGEATAVRMMLAATGFKYGADKIGIVAATGCNTVYGSTYPYNPFKTPWTNSLFENAPADAMGIRLRWDQAGHQDWRLWVFGGDGAMFDIGFQSLSRMLASGMDIKALVLDTQVYSNTGGQASTATYTGQEAKMAAFGAAVPGKRERRKELGQILMMHPHTYVAQTSPALLNHFYRAIMGANEFPGPAVVIAYATCQPEHGVGDDQSVAQEKLAVESRAFPVFVYDPRKGERLKEQLDLRGNPALKDDWSVDMQKKTPLDFIAFAKTEGRFSRHFNKEGEPDKFLLEAQQDRLENWRRLQELAGIR